MAFNWDTLGSSLAVLPLTASGRPDKAGLEKSRGLKKTSSVVFFLFFLVFLIFLYIFA
jgi:hypothetical protein